MFTGIIESLGEITAIRKEQSNIHFTIKSNISKELKIDQSVSHNGVCLTVVQCNEQEHTVTAIDETLQKTSLKQWALGDKVNLERCMIMNGRLDGHIVQGHVDTVATCKLVENKNGSWVYQFEYALNPEHITVEKGSICVNGISLTVVNSGKNTFEVAIIPYTYEHTNMHLIQQGSLVNLEFDVIGKYVRKMMNS